MQNVRSHPSDGSPHVAADRPVPIVRWGLLLSAVGGVVVAIGCLSSPLWSSDPALDRRTIIAATVATTVAQIFGLVPVNAMRRIGGVWGAFGWVVAMPVRFVLSLVAAIALVKLGQLPTLTTVLTMVVAYLALLATETTLMFKFMQVPTASLGPAPGARSGTRS